jgi:hypothetical protein
MNMAICYANTQLWTKTKLYEKHNLLHLHNFVQVRHFVQLRHFIQINSTIHKYIHKSTTQPCAITIIKISFSLRKIWIYLAFFLLNKLFSLVFNKKKKVWQQQHQGSNHVDVRVDCSGEGLKIRGFWNSTRLIHW